MPLSNCVVICGVGNIHTYTVLGFVRVRHILISIGAACGACALHAAYSHMGQR
jgi:hypothetical protein